MKKIFASIAALCLGLGAFAQGFNFGVEGGFNINGITGAPYAVENEKLGMKSSAIGGGFIGGFAQYDFIEMFGIRADFYFAQNGQSFIGNGDAQGRYWSLSNNLKLPVLFQLHLIGNRLNLMVGPQIGVILGGREYLTLNGLKLADSWAFVKGEYIPFQFSLLAGIEVRLGDHFGIDVRYDHGFTNVWKEEFYSSRNQSRSVQIGVVYHFDQL